MPPPPTQKGGGNYCGTHSHVGARSETPLMPTAVATPPEPRPCGEVVAVETEASGPDLAIPSQTTPAKPPQSCAAVILEKDKRVQGWFHYSHQSPGGENHTPMRCLRRRTGATPSAPPHRLRQDPPPHRRPRLLPPPHHQHRGGRWRHRWGEARRRTGGGGPSGSAPGRVWPTPPALSRCTPSRCTSPGHS